MKKLTLIALVLCVIGCKRDSISPDVKIMRVTMSGGIHQTFEYDSQGRLTRENEFYSCTVTPMNEHLYNYKEGKLEKVTSVIRSLYSSTAAFCDPAKGEKMQQIFSYDNSGRISKVAGLNSITEYIYNQQGFLSKKLYGAGSNKSSEYFYDSSGNVIKQITPEGSVTEYEYDNAPNPFYFHRPGALTPFTMSRNNIIKGKGASNFTRQFEYKSGRPVKVLEDNGQTYEYHY